MSSLIIKASHYGWEIEDLRNSAAKSADMGITTLKVQNKHLQSLKEIKTLYSDNNQVE
jgi:hypothetical protein